MNIQKQILGLLLGGFTLLTSSLSSAEAVPPLPQGVWTSHRYTSAVYDYYECQTLYQAAYAVISSINGRKMNFTCNAWGAELTFESLMLDENAPQEDQVLASWHPVQIQFYRDSRTCYYLAMHLERIVKLTEYENLRFSAFCNGGTGSVIYSFDALTPAP